MSPVPARASTKRTLLAPPLERFDFAKAIAAIAPDGLHRGPTRTLQINVGKRCNQACHHCHVEAGPHRTEQMPDVVVDRLLEIIASDTLLECVDITGGAPELHPRFRDLVEGAVSAGKRVIDRCNLTILLEAGQEDLASFLAGQGAEITASLPCYGPDNVDKQRGHGVFSKSIEALRRLNALGYGQPESSLRLNLVYNPGGATLPGAQAPLQAAYRRELLHRYDVQFHELFTLTNMPINRFARQLAREGQFDAYMHLLTTNFNGATVEHLMCRDLVSVGWDGRLYDCDFNQMLELPLGGGSDHPTVFDLDKHLVGRPIATGGHCFGCTAGAGSSCSGALETGERPQ